MALRAGPLFVAGRVVGVGAVLVGGTVPPAGVVLAGGAVLEGGAVVVGGAVLGGTDETVEGVLDEGDEELGARCPLLSRRTATNDLVAVDSATSRSNARSVVAKARRTPRAEMTGRRAGRHRRCGGAHGLGGMKSWIDAD
ncbi:MAG TPA: hypothetical protein VEI83_10765 [Acidimicrobiales bacterium]|nr:hypothetical protein [Acidimicrobiales bacterium]